MVTRAWFAFSVLWFALLFGVSLNPNANESGRHWLFAFAVAPLLGGLFLKRVGRYIVRGD